MQVGLLKLIVGLVVGGWGVRDKHSRLRQTANVNLYNVTKFFP